MFALNTLLLLSERECRGSVSATQRRCDQEVVQVIAAGAGRVPVWHRRYHKQPDGPACSDRHQRIPRLVSIRRHSNAIGGNIVFWLLVCWLGQRQHELPSGVLLVSGYEGVPEFFSDLLNHITAVLQNHSPDLAGEQPKGLPLNTVPSAGPWIVDGEGGLKGSRQRLACNSTMSPNFQQHCVSTIATKASSQ